MQQFTYPFPENHLHFGIKKMYLSHWEILFDEGLWYNYQEGGEMKIKTEQDLSCNEMEITIKYCQKDKQVNRIIDFLQSFDMQIRCDIDNTERMVNVPDIYYIESVDKKTFVYLEKTVCHTKLRLYQLKDKLHEYGFVQISKSCILNINALESIKPLLNSRMEATLKNGEKVYINRNYLKGVKKALKGDEI